MKLTYEQISYLAQWQPFLRSVMAAVTEGAQDLSTDADPNRKLLAGQVLDNPKWARDKFVMNVAMQVGKEDDPVVTVNSPEVPEFPINDLAAFKTAVEKWGSNPVFSIPERTTFDAKIKSIIASIWSAEAKV